MSVFVESLARLYRANKITKEKLNFLLEERKINQIEYEYICSI